MKRIALALLLVTVCLPSAYGVDMILVNEDFESYANDTELFQNWFSGTGGQNAGLIDETIYPDAYPEPGQGVEHDGGVVVEWLGLSPGNAIAPSETQSIVVRADMFDDGLGNAANKRMSLGLRGIASSGSKILELGFYNSDSCDPTLCEPTVVTREPIPDPNTPGYYVGTGYAYRMQLFGAFDEPLIAEPDWQYFQLPQELDRRPAGPVGDYNNNDVNDAADYTAWRDRLGQNVTLPNEDPTMTPGMVTPEDYTVWVDHFGEEAPPGNGLINSFDVGPGWHRYQATITPTEITVEIDLYRDGLRNTSMTPDPMTGIRPGTPGVDASITLPVISNGTYDSLRFGGPSGVSSGGGGLVFDNIYLALEDVAMGSGALGGSNVPEPAAVFLVVLGTLTLAFCRRRRR